MKTRFIKPELIEYPDKFKKKKKADRTKIFVRSARDVDDLEFEIDAKQIQVLKSLKACQS